MTTHVAMAGLGAIGRALARALDEGVPNLALSAVAARDTGKAQAWLAEHEIDCPVVPLSEMPDWVRILANLNPLHQTVELVRNAVVYGWDGWVDVARLGMLVLFGVLLWRISIHAMTRKLID